MKAQRSWDSTVKTRCASHSLGGGLQWEIVNIGRSICNEAADEGMSWRQIDGLEFEKEKIIWNYVIFAAFK